MNSIDLLWTIHTRYENCRPDIMKRWRPVVNSTRPSWTVHTIKKNRALHGSLLVYRMTKLVVHYSLQFKIQILDFFIYVEYKLYILEAPFSPGFHVSILTFLFNKGERKYNTCIKNITENNMVLLLFYSIRSQNEATFGWASAYYYSVTRS
jgi:hypothetical protein